VNSYNAHTELTWWIQTVFFIAFIFAVVQAVALKITVDPLSQVNWSFSQAVAQHGFIIIIYLPAKP